MSRSLSITSTRPFGPAIPIAGYSTRVIALPQAWCRSKAPRQQVSRAIHTTFAALAYANPPEGRTCWTTQLLANELIVRPVVPSISDGRYREGLKKRPQAVAQRALMHS